MLILFFICVLYCSSQNPTVFYTYIPIADLSVFDIFPTINIACCLYEENVFIFIYQGFCMLNIVPGQTVFIAEDITEIVVAQFYLVIYPSPIVINSPTFPGFCIYEFSLFGLERLSSDGQIEKKRYCPA